MEYTKNGKVKKIPIFGGIGQIFDFYHQSGFTQFHLTTMGGGLGVNEFVFTLDQKN